jgi:hypothetical protein
MSVDLDAAAVKAARPNDLIPARLEDRVAGRIGNRFSESLRHQIEQGEYDPTPAYFIPVPKGGSTTRPAALLTLADRAVYQALVDELAPRIEDALMDHRVVLGPRATTPSRPWAEFEQSPLQYDASHIAIIDVAGFYEVLPHDGLMKILIRVTGRHETVHALSVFLERIMRGRRGVPQGLSASDVLATLYLTPVDQAMLRTGRHYVRRGDDIRVAVDSYPDGQAAIAAVEAQLRDLGLLLNPAKSKVVRAETYFGQIQAVEMARQEIRDRLGSERVQRLYEMEREELEELAIEELAGESELEEIFFEIYHGEISPEEIIEQLEDRVQPSDVEVAEALFRQALAVAPGSDVVGELSKEEFHGRIATALTILTAGRSGTILENLEELLRRFPDETAAAVAYLAAVAPSEPKAVIRVIEQFLLPDRYRPPWQEAMLLAVVVPEGEEVSTEFETSLRGTVADEEAEWLVRVLAARILARRGSLGRDELNRLWQLAPAPFKPDLIAAAADLIPVTDWAMDFLAGCKGDVVLEVVEKDVRLALEERLLVRRASAGMEAEDYLALTEGSRVFHARWGRGSVVSVSKGEIPAAIIEFSGHRKQLLLPYAPLTRLDI